MYHFVALVGDITIEQCQPVVDDLRPTGAVPVPMPMSTEDLKRDLIVFGRFTEKDWDMDLEDQTPPEFTQEELASGVMDFGLFRRTQLPTGKPAGYYSNQHDPGVLYVEEALIADKIARTLIMPGKSVLAAVVMPEHCFNGMHGETLSIKLMQVAKELGVPHHAIYTLPYGGMKVQLVIPARNS